MADASGRQADTKAARTRERIELSRPPDMPGIDVLLVENCAHRWRVFHETYSFCILLKGEGRAEWVYRGRTYNTSAGDLMLLEPGETHANTRITPPADFRVLLVEPELVAEAARELGAATSRPHLRFANLTDPEIFRIFVRLHASIERGSSLLERHSCLVACIRAFLQRCAETPLSSPRRTRVHPRIRRAREFIEEHYRDAISLDDLATAAGLSRYHLARAFTSAYGVPPHAFQIHVRVARARLLLAAGIPPSEVASDMGFADQSHFAGHFKRAWKTSPGKYAHAAGRHVSCR